MSSHAILVLLVGFLVMAEMAKFWQLPWPPTNEKVLAEWRVKRELAAGIVLLSTGFLFLILDIRQALLGVAEAHEELWADLALIGAFLAIVLHKLRTAKVFVTPRGVWFADRQFHAWDRFHPMEIDAGVLRERAFLGLKVTVPESFAPQVRALYRSAIESARSEAPRASAWLSRP